MYDVYIRNRRNSGRALIEYGEMYPLRLQPSSKIFQRISMNMSASGCINKKRNKYQVAATINEINTLAQIYINPENSSRLIARECGISSRGVRKIIKKYKYHDYKFTRVQTLHPGDLQRRIAFCRWFQNKLHQNRCSRKRFSGVTKALLQMRAYSIEETSIIMPLKTRTYYRKLDPR